MFRQSGIAAMGRKTRHFWEGSDRDRASEIPMAPMAAVTNRSPFPLAWVVWAAGLALPALLIGAICVRCLWLWGDPFEVDVVLLNGDHNAWAPAFKPMEVLWLGAVLISAWIVVVIVAFRRLAEWRRARP